MNQASCNQYRGPRWRLACGRNASEPILAVLSNCFFLEGEKTDVPIPNRLMEVTFFGLHWGRTVHKDFAETDPIMPSKHVRELVWLNQI